MIESSSEEPLPVRVVSESIGEYIGRLGPVWVEGEVAEITRRPGSQMAFIRLKDTSVDMSLQVTCHRSILEAIDPLPENAHRRLCKSQLVRSSRHALAHGSRDPTGWIG